MNSLDFTDTVLSVALISDCICTLLPLDDLKQFRLVCRKWKDTSEAAFKERVRICFDFDDCNRKYRNHQDVHIYYNTSSFTQYPAPEDLSVFFRNSQMTHPFTAIRISNALPWTNSALTEFFSTEGKHITDLVLHEVKLKYDEDTANGHQNIEVRGFHLMSIFGGIVNLEKMDVECYAEDSTRFSLTLHDLARVESIRLKYCIVEVTDCQITPIELEFADLTFVQSDKIVDTVLLNDFVNFTLMEKLTTSASLNQWNCKTTKMKLNLFGSENVKLVKVNHWEDSILDGEIFDDIVDFKNSSWEIETLDLYAIPFQETNNMIIKNLFIDRIQFSPLHFPQSLQKLQLFENVEFPENLQWNFSLPKLKILDLTDKDIINTVFPHLLNCFPNLVELKCRRCSPGIASIDINFIPPHVQKMMFDGIEFDFLGGGTRPVDTLVLISVNLNFATKVCNHFVPKNLIVFVEIEELRVGMNQSLLKALTKICDQGIIFGLFACWNAGPENEDFVFPSVDIDTPGEFYSYINGSGDVITCKFGARNNSPLKFIKLISQMTEFQ